MPGSRTPTPGAPTPTPGIPTLPIAPGWLMPGSRTPTPGAPTPTPATPTLPLAPGWLMPGSHTPAPGAPTPAVPPTRPGWLIPGSRACSAPERVAATAPRTSPCIHLLRLLFISLPLWLIIWGSPEPRILYHLDEIVTLGIRAEIHPGAKWMPLNGGSIAGSWDPKWGKPRFELSWLLVHSGGPRSSPLGRLAMPRSRCVCSERDVLFAGS